MVERALCSGWRAATAPGAHARAQRRAEFALSFTYCTGLGAQRALFGLHHCDNTARAARGADWEGQARVGGGDGEEKGTSSACACAARAAASATRRTRAS